MSNASNLTLKGTSSSNSSGSTDRWYEEASAKQGADYNETTGLSTDMMPWAGSAAEAEAQKIYHEDINTLKKNRQQPRPILNDNDDSWNKTPFMVQLGGTFTKVSDSIRQQFNADESGTIRNANAGLLGNATAIEAFMGYPKDWVDRPYFKDTRIGGNDAFNVQWGFNRDDDIVYPMMRTGNTGGEVYDHTTGMGRVYASTIERNQQILWLSFGVPRFTELVTFYQNAFDSDAIKFNITGSTSGMGSLGALINAAGNLAYDIITMPLKFLGSWFSNPQIAQVSKFYELRTTMHLYYRYVDGMLTDWMVNVGMYDQSLTASEQALPKSTQEAGISIFDINALRARVSRGKGEIGTWQADSAKFAKMEPKKYDEDASNIWSDLSDWTANVGAMAMGATQFVGFRIEKSTGSSESFSNSTSPSQLAENINSGIREKASQKFDLGAGGGALNWGDGAIANTIEGVYSGASKVLSGAASMVSADGLASALAGGAFIDIPEQWTSSDFGKSYNVSFKLFSPYGDIESIRRCIAVPLFLFLGGVLPRQAGHNSYSAPFLCRAYCKGMFSVPLGIIDNLSIERGGAEFGWTYGKLPTQITVSMSIKDLSPAMYMAMHDSLFKKWEGSHSSFNEYMQTISGLGIYERLNRAAQMKRRMQYTAHKIRNDVLNPNRFASFLADTGIANFVGTVAGAFGHSFMPRN